MSDLGAEAERGHLYLDSVGLKQRKGSAAAAESVFESPCTVFHCQITVS